MKFQKYGCVISQKLNCVWMHEPSANYFYVKTKILPDFHICISLSLEFTMVILELSIHSLARHLFACRVFFFFFFFFFFVKHLILFFFLAVVKELMQSVRWEPLPCQVSQNHSKNKWWWTTILEKLQTTTWNFPIKKGLYHEWNFSEQPLSRKLRIGYFFFMCCVTRFK